jgi:hypothetical protein
MDRIDLQRMVERVDGLFEPAQFGVRYPLVVERVDIIRIDVQR